MRMLRLDRMVSLETLDPFSEVRLRRQEGASRVKRVILGSLGNLSDLLNGGLSDLLSGNTIG